MHRMLRPFFYKLAVLATLVALLAPSLPAQNAAAQVADGRVKTTIGAWQISCGRPPGSRAEKCAAVQSVTAEDRPNVGLTVIFQRAIEDNKLMLLVVAPLGVLLPSKLGLFIDGKKVGSVEYLRCGKIGCFAEAEIPDSQKNKFQTGKTALFTIFQTPEEGIAIPIELKGFTEALKQIK